LAALLVVAIGVDGFFPRPGGQGPARRDLRVLKRGEIDCGTLIDVMRRSRVRVGGPLDSAAWAGPEKLAISLGILGGRFT